MLTSDPDRYYSPSAAANALVSLVQKFKHRNVLDSNCGSGSLLEAMSTNFPRIKCGGIDVDRRAIVALKKRRPEWNLIPGDALKEATWSKYRAVNSESLDTAVLNPPFSMGAAKGLHVRAWGNDVRSSLAMAHILATLEYTSPKRLVAILPESWAYSGMDAAARKLIDTRYRIHIDRSFAASTFHGARVHSILVLLERRTRHELSVDNLQNIVPTNVNLEVIRGRLACFKAKDSTDGIPFLHSTEIKLVGEISALRKVIPHTGNPVNGAIIFLPRVGLPRLEHFKAVWIRGKIQPSDCVLALKFKTIKEAKNAATIIEKNWEGLIELYKGTGARYITVERLSTWLSGLNL